MNWRICTLEDVPELSILNGLLHEDEGAQPMEANERKARLRKWIDTDYTAVLFLLENKTLGYALFRSTDPDSEGLDPGIFIRQFFVVRDLRRQGIGRQMFAVLSKHIWPAGCGVLLETEYENKRAQDFWNSLGFSPHHVSFKRLPNA